MKGSSNKLRHSVLVLSDLPHSELASYASHVEAIGFDGMWYADERFFHEPYVGLAVIAGATERMFLGPGVTDPKSRHPGLTAAAINSINELSGGRAVLGLAAGKSGFHNLGLTTERSAQAIREAAVVINQLLAGDDVTLHGEVVYIDRARMRVEANPVPICIAASGPMTLRVAGELADMVMIPHCVSLELLEHRMKSVVEGAERAGRDRLPEIILRLDTAVADDHDEAVQMTKTRLGRTLWASYPSIPFLDVLGLRLPDELDRRLREAGPFQYTFDLTVFEKFADAIPDEIHDAICLGGTPGEVAARVEQLAGAGVAEINILPVPSPDQTARDVVDLYSSGLGLSLR